MASIQAPTAYQTKVTTIAGTAVAISAAAWSWTSGYLALADHAVITAHTEPVCMTWDGTTPTATLGMYIPAGGTVTVVGNANVQAVQLIRQGSSSATVSITLEKYP
jgi:hypothetical protein